MVRFDQWMLHLWKNIRFFRRFGFVVIIAVFSFTFFIRWKFRNVLFIAFVINIAAMFLCLYFYVALTLWLIRRCDVKFAIFNFRIFYCKFVIHVHWIWHRFTNVLFHIFFHIFFERVYFDYFDSLVFFLTMKTGLAVRRVTLITVDAFIWMWFQAFRLWFIFHWCFMTVSAFLAISFICASSRKMFVFITIEALLDSAISIVYFRCMHLVCHDYFVIFDFVDFLHDSKSYYQSFDVFFFFWL